MDAHCGCSHQGSIDPLYALLLSSHTHTHTHTSREEEGKMRVHRTYDFHTFTSSGSRGPEHPGGVMFLTENEPRPMNLGLKKKKIA